MVELLETFNPKQVNDFKKVLQTYSKLSIAKLREDKKTKDSYLTAFELSDGRYFKCFLKAKMLSLHKVFCEMVALKEITWLEFEKIYFKLNFPK